MKRNLFGCAGLVRSVSLTPRKFVDLPQSFSAPLPRERGVDELCYIARLFGVRALIATL